MNRGLDMQTRTHHLLEQAAAMYPFDLAGLALIRSSQYSPNDIYSFEKDGRPYILRVATHDADHTEYTAAEMEWLRFLHDRGIPVSRPLPMLVQRLLALPRHQDNYGLIHSDFHQGNFFVDKGRVRVFDFDDSLYGYFALDMGIALHHALRWTEPLPQPERQGAVEIIVRSFMRGYKRANALPPDDLLTVREFIRFRQLCNFGWAYAPDSHEMPEEQHNLMNQALVTGCRVEDEWFLA